MKRICVTPPTTGMGEEGSEEEEFSEDSPEDNIMVGEEEGVFGRVTSIRREK